MKEELDNEPIYNINFLKAKIKSSSDEAANFHDEEMTEVGSNNNYLVVILFDFVLKKDYNLFTSVFKNANTLK